jgi:hypothetical protein
VGVLLCLRCYKNMRGSARESDDWESVLQRVRVRVCVLRARKSARLRVRERARGSSRESDWESVMTERVLKSAC